MEKLHKNNKINTTKIFFERNPIFFISNGLNHKSTKKTKTEQHAQVLNFNSKKINNKFIKVVFKKSIYKSFNFFLVGITCFVKPILNKFKLVKKFILEKLRSLEFGVSACKLNNKIYSLLSLQKNYFYSYLNNMLVCLQFLTVNIKFNVKKIRRK